MSNAKMWEVFTIREVQGKTQAEDTSYWTKIGAAFENRDGSINVVLSALPIGAADGQARIQLRTPLPKDNDRGGDSRERSRDDRDTRGPRR